MHKYVLTFIAGVYVGTYFDCKPQLEQLETFVREYFPERK